MEEISKLIIYWTTFLAKVKYRTENEGNYSQINSFYIFFLSTSNNFNVFLGRYVLSEFHLQNVVVSQNCLKARLEFFQLDHLRSSGVLKD